MPFRHSAILALAMPCLIASAAPAFAQDAQTSPDGTFVRLDKIMARIEAVRYENVATNRPSVIIYATVRNDSVNPILLAANTFDGTSLLNGSTVHTGASYTFATGFEPGREGRFESRTLGVSRTALVAFRYQLSARAPTAPMQLTLREAPLFKLPGKKGGGEATFNVQGYAGAPAAPPKLTTPPQLALSPGGYQTIRVADSSFHQTGALRIRADQVQYGRSQAGGANPENIEVTATAQNTLSVPVMVHASSLSGSIVSDGRPNTRSSTVLLYNGGTAATSFTLASGEWMYFTASHAFQNDAALRAARRLSLSYSPFDQAGGTFTIDIPRLTALTDPKPEALKQGAAAEPATTAAGGGDFKKTAYMDVKLDQVARRKTGEVDVTLTVRNKIGRRLGMQHDWQTYSLLGSDGVEYRTDGNHYGTSGSDHLASTVWLENDNEAKRTHVFARVPAGVKPARLIIRESGVEKASIDLPH